MEIFHQECRLIKALVLIPKYVIVFAPVMTVIKTSSTKDAIHLANNTRFGLGGAVFGNDQAECSLVAHNMKCGMVR